MKITTSHGMSADDREGKRMADNDMSSSRKKANVVVEAPHAVSKLNRLHYSADDLVEVDIVGLNAPTFPELEVYEGHEKRIVSSAPHGLPSMAVRKTFSGHGLLLVALEWTAVEKPNQLVVPVSPDDWEPVWCMISDHKKMTDIDGRMYLCKELATLCTVYKNDKGELSVNGVGIGDCLGTWRIIDKGFFAEVQCVSISYDRKTRAELKTEMKLEVKLELGQLKDSICVMQNPQYLKRLEKKQDDVIDYVTARNTSQFFFMKF